MSEEKIILSKLERQILLYEIFCHFTGWELETIFEVLPISRRTLQRDVKDLTDAGLISVRFSKKEQSYVPSEKEIQFHEDTENKYRNRHLKRLNRLGKLITSLYNDEVSEEKRFVRSEYISCKDYYQQLFPNISTRTMERDFLIMNRLGYHIKFNRQIQYYEFYDNSNYRVDFGVFKEDGVLKRIINNEAYDFDMQELDIDVILDPDSYFGDDEEK